MSTDETGTGRFGAANIVVDAAGGDRAPAEPVAGSVQAAESFPDTRVTLVGPEGQIEGELKKIGSRPDNLRIVHAPESIEMDESPVSALRGKKESSINVGMKLVAAGEADAFLSAGNTGAVVAAANLRLGRIKHVQRPGIAVPITAVDHPVLIMDVGANAQCKPSHLLQYGLMSNVFAREVLGMDDPRVGLLNVGEEEPKGRQLEKEAYDLLANAPLNFVGNVEPQDVFFQGCEILVCDGFVGNVMLKTSEKLVEKLLSFFRTEINQSLRRKLGFALCRDVFKTTREMSDYAEYGGAPLLGVNGITIICHGHSEARAFVNAVREARTFMDHEVNASIAEMVGANAASEENG
ncbi:MAG: phosphate acyltransferase PlsX [Planctomycetota bacterium]